MSLRPRQERQELEHRSWLLRHKIWTALGALLIIGAIQSAVHGGGSSNNSLAPTSRPTRATARLRSTPRPSAAKSGTPTTPAPRATSPKPAPTYLSTAFLKAFKASDQSLAKRLPTAAIIQMGSDICHNTRNDYDPSYALADVESAFTGGTPVLTAEQVKVARLAISVGCPDLRRHLSQFPTPKPFTLDASAQSACEVFVSGEADAVTDQDRSDLARAVNVFARQSKTLEIVKAAGMLTDTVKSLTGFFWDASVSNFADVCLNGGYK